MVELGVLFLQVLLARVLDEEQVGVVRAEIAWRANVDVSRREVDRSSLLANSLSEKPSDLAIGWLAGLI